MNNTKTLFDIGDKISFRINGIISHYSVDKNGDCYTIDVNGDIYMRLYVDTQTLVTSAAYLVEDDKDEGK